MKLSLYYYDFILISNYLIFFPVFSTFNFLSKDQPILYMVIILDSADVQFNDQYS